MTPKKSGDMWLESMPGVKADRLENLLLPSTRSGLLARFIGACISLYVNWAMLHIFVCTQICMPVCMHTCGSQRSTFGVFLYCSLPYFLRQGLSLNIQPIDSPILASGRISGICLFPPGQHWDLRCRPMRDLRSSCLCSKSMLCIL